MSVPTPGNLRFRRAARTLNEIVYGIIDRRRASGEDRGDLLSLLLRAQDEDGGADATDEQIRDEVMTLFLAGHETTALALSWAWYLLSRHPEAEATLVLATVAQQFRLSLAPGHEVTPRPLVVLHMRDGLRMVPERR